MVNKKKDLWHSILPKFIAILIIGIYLMPIYVVVVTSLKPMSDHSSRLIPTATLYIENYIKVFKSSNILTAIKNSAIITIGSVGIVVIAGCLAAFPMARNRGLFSKIVKAFILGVMMVPGLSMIVGIYSTLVSIHAISTFWGLIVVCAAFGLPMSMYMYSNFISSIPESLDEAAAIDGAGVLRTFFQIIIPQLKPVTVSIILLQGISSWNEYGYALYILQKPSMYNITLTVKQYFSAQLKDLNGAAACAVVAIIPVVIIYLLLQKYFVQGALDSAVKG